MAPEEPGEIRIARGLLSTDDKSGLAELVGSLTRLHVELWATSGTRTALGGSGTVVHPLEDLTGVGSWFQGRVKTLHPAVFGGILAPRSTEGLQELSARKLLPFDLVVVNFYPFERRALEAADPEELIDIGGVSLARAAAKNHRFVTVLTDPSQYPALMEELAQHQGRVSERTRRALAIQAFERCARYDAAISSGLEPGPPSARRFPRSVLLRRDDLPLRYGENPDQGAASYIPTGAHPFARTAPPFDVVKGDPPSFTNLLDLDAAARIVAGLEGPAAAVVKHATPCGAAEAPSLGEALAAAVATDPVARYGCAIAVNRPVGPEVLDGLHGVFVDLLAAPAFDPTALARLEPRKKLKLLRLDPTAATSADWEAKNALGRLLVEETGRRVFRASELRLVAGSAAPPAILEALAFAWQVVRHAKSNAIVLAQGRTAVGIGSGQPTRVKAVELACEVAGPRARGSVLASDAFFPFADGIEAAGRAGVAAVVQPGGSVRDPEVLAAAERYGMTMYFTGWRVFRH